MANKILLRTVNGNLVAVAIEGNGSRVDLVSVGEIAFDSTTKALVMKFVGAVIEVELEEPVPEPSPGPNAGSAEAA